MTGKTENEYASILPIFLAIDTSGSMTAAGEMVPAIQDGCMTIPEFADMPRMGVITFNSTATVYMPFGKPAESASPALTATELTSYSAAFRLLRAEVETAITSLRADGFKQIVRPTVFFITDGDPTDEVGSGDAAFAELTDPSFKYNPNISCSVWVKPSRRT